MATSKKHAYNVKDLVHGKQRQLASSAVQHDPRPASRHQPPVFTSVAAHSCGHLSRLYCTATPRSPQACCCVVVHMLGCRACQHELSSTKVQRSSMVWSLGQVSSTSTQQQRRHYNSSLIKVDKASELRATTTNREDGREARPRDLALSSRYDRRRPNRPPGPAVRPGNRAIYAGATTPLSSPRPGSVGAVRASMA